MVAITWTRGRTLRRSVPVSVRLEVRDRNLSETFLRRVPTQKSHFEGRADLADGDDDGLEAESQDSRSECRRCREHGYIERGVDQEGHEAEESPSHKGAVRARGEASLEVQGVQSLVRTVVGAVSARSAVGHAICEHGRRALSVQGVRWGSICEHGRQRHDARSAVGQSICEHGRQRYQCKECGGSGICEHGRERSTCKECGGASICEHGRMRSQCKECGGASICEHGRRRSKCKECGGSSICEHGRQRYNCKECGGAGICEHGRRRHRCKECS